MKRSLLLAPTLRTVILRPGLFGPKDLGSLYRCPRKCELQGSFAPLNNVGAQDDRRKGRRETEVSLLPAPTQRTVILRPGSFGPKDLGSLQRCPKQCELQGSFAPLNNVGAQDDRRNDCRAK